MTWSQLKEWVGWRSQKSPQQLADKQGKVTRSPRKMAEIMSDHYYRKVKIIRENQPQSNVNLKTAEEIGKHKPGINLREITQEEVLKTMQKMSNSKALGPDLIQADLLKKSSKHTSRALTHIINLSIRTK